MVVGVDFDNTIVCYDGLFHRIAVEQGLIPASTPGHKQAVRDCLRRQGQEREWTELQGYVYGPRMAEAQPFPGVLEFFRRGVSAGLSLYVISHKTRRAAAGPPYDLHQSATDWLAAQGFFDPARIGLSRKRVLFALTRQEKIRHICATGCTHFVDDLEETFLEESFPAAVVKFWFGHREAPASLPGVKPAADWAQITKYVFRASH